MHRYKVVIAMRSIATPHVDTIATYRIESAGLTGAVSKATRKNISLMLASGPVRRLTVTMQRTVSP